MKTKLQTLPAIFFASALIYSCASDSNQAEKSRSMSPVFDEKAKADSVSYPNANSTQNSPSSGTGTYSVTTTDANGCTSGLLASNSNVVANFSDASGLKQIISSSAARATQLDSTHRFVRTADLKFRVKNVAGATYRIEELTAKFKGYVADTKLTSQMQDLKEVPVTKDSSLETMRYVVMNTITLRIPSENLDTALKCFVPLIDYLDFRNINMRDITLDVLSNRLAQNRLGKYNARLSTDIDQKGQKLHDIQSAEQSMLSAQEGSDNALIENLRQDDQVRYSTITLYIYQRETIRQELVKREKAVDAYEPGLGKKMGESLSAGWHGLQSFLVILVILWPLWLVVLITYIFVKWIMKRNRKVN
jgi:hypothetical protein